MKLHADKFPRRNNTGENIPMLKKKLKAEKLVLVSCGFQLILSVPVAFMDQQKRLSMYVLAIQMNNEAYTYLSFMLGLCLGLERISESL